MNSKNDPHATNLIELAKLEAMDAQLSKWRDELRLAIQTAQSHAADGIAAYYWASAETGLARIKTFMNSLEDARFAMQMGKPLTVGQLKPRSTAKKLTPPAKAKAAKDAAMAKKKKG